MSGRLWLPHERRAKAAQQAGYMRAHPGKGRRMSEINRQRRQRALVMIENANALPHCSLGDMLVIDPPQHARTMAALAIAAQGLHGLFDEDCRTKPFVSRRSCILTTLAMVDFLRGAGFAQARPMVCRLIAVAHDRDQMVHSIGCGMGQGQKDAKGWDGHMVTQLGGYFIDMALYALQREAWRGLCPGMIAAPITRPAMGPIYGHEVITALGFAQGDDFMFQLYWTESEAGETWQGSPDCEPSRRFAVVEHLLARLPKWF